MDVVSIGETMVLFASKEDGQLRYASNFSARVAGAETNTLIGLAKLGHKTGWISRVGADELGAKIIQSVRGEGVDTTYVAMDEQAPTGLFLKEQTTVKTANILYYRKGSAASRLEPADINEDYVKNAKFLYLTGITPLLSKSCEQTTFVLIEMAKKHHVKIVFDPNIRKKLLTEEKQKHLLERLIGIADIVLPGYGEGHYLFGTNNSEEIADRCLQLGAQLTVVKLGEKGAYYKSTDQSGYVAPIPVKEVVDPIGAGDGFAAGVLSGLLDGLAIKEAVGRGCAIGAFVTQVHGDIEGLPSRQTLHAFQQNREDVNR
ncbi:2-dehydro-3-deoxygluconokinase [Shouchella clausii]|uniref:Sugar kinase n=1 Tax=Shouchella rhizosphaerae TaxID=866786 RepID=A0ABZ2CMS6_9BACI|nr:MULTISPECIES: sugar kinase [Shouchella]MBX0317355.1 sugar kinase [Shouchella clausii]GIN10019.1 2-dehydro-3-deoxygluconokinase [Shouchella clausii]SHL87970.1 2-dehydro-3-deoxygluconokinase [Shouchella rhizosphaerae]